MRVVAALPPPAHRREPAPVDEAEARQVQELADRLGVDRSELPRHGMSQTRRVLFAATGC